MVDAIEEFQDFTVATPWEKYAPQQACEFMLTCPGSFVAPLCRVCCRFVASLEQILRFWLRSGQAINLVVLLPYRFKLPFGSMSVLPHLVRQLGITKTFVVGTQDHVKTVQHQLAFRSEPYSLTFVAANGNGQQHDMVQRVAGACEVYLLVHA